MGRPLLTCFCDLTASCLVKPRTFPASGSKRANVPKSTPVSWGVAASTGACRARQVTYKRVTPLTCDLRQGCGSCGRGSAAALPVSFLYVDLQVARLSVSPRGRNLYLNKKSDLKIRRLLICVWAACGPWCIAGLARHTGYVLDESAQHTKKCRVGWKEAATPSIPGDDDHWIPTRVTDNQPSRHSTARGPARGPPSTGPDKLWVIGTVHRQEMSAQHPSAACLPCALPVWQLLDPQSGLGARPNVRLLRADHLPELSPSSLWHFFLFLAMFRCLLVALVYLQRRNTASHDVVFLLEALQEPCRGSMEGSCVYSGELVTSYRG